MGDFMMILALFSMCCAASEAPGLPVQWDMECLSRPPAIYPAEEFEAEGVRALFYEGLPYEGKPTRVFAWMGIPDHAEGERVPGMVLVHGGGGTAFDEWVRVWTQRGYAAIAMDMDGTVPKGEHGSRPTHEFSGPTNFGSASPMTGAKEDYWVYHAVADIVLAQSLLGSQPDVDSERIGLTGISWGGFLTNIAAAVDARFRFAVPVYGCGYINEVSWKGDFENMGPEKAEEWMRLWDPSQYVAAIAIPTLWINGANDPHYHLGVHSRTYLQAGGTKTLSIQPGLGHSHPAGWAPREIYAYADSALKDGAPLVRIIAEGGEATSAMAVFEGGTPAKAELLWTRDASDWVAAVWERLPVSIEDNRVVAELPEECAAYFINLTDNRGLITSSVCRVRKQTAPE